MGPRRPPGAGPRSLDTAGLEAFAARVQRAIAADGRQPPPVLDRLGFWNRAPGLLYVGLLLLLLLSLALAGGVVASTFSGADVRIGNAAPAAGFLVLPPLGAGWLLRKAWRRRRAVLARGQGQG
jgi:hypothetical protein